MGLCFCVIVNNVSVFMDDQEYWAGRDDHGLTGGVFGPGSSAIVGIFAWREVVLDANVNEGAVKNKEIKQS